MVLSKDELQEKYMQFHTLSQQLKQVKEYLENIETQITELGQIIANLDQISGIDKGTEILVPVSNGIFIKANVTKSDEFIVNVGSNTLVAKDKQGIKDLLEKQRRELNEVQHKLLHDFETLQVTAMTIQEEIRQTAE
jgi:prefoldin alpha subunit